MAKYRFILNGKEVEYEGNPTKTLLEVLREYFKLTGTKESCNKGECGACTVLINGEAVNSCLVPIPQVEGQEVVTIEGLSKNGQLDELQESFISEGAIQCGYCTPGFILSAKALLLKNKRPTREEIRKAISGNLCRCTGYTKIISAIEKACTKEG